MFGGVTFTRDSALIWMVPLINVKKTIHSTEKELDIIDKMTPITTTHVTKTTVMFEVNDFFLESTVFR